MLSTSQFISVLIVFVGLGLFFVREFYRPGLRKASAILTIMSVCMVTGCTANEPKSAEYTKITADEAVSMMEDGGMFILLDVRTEEEYNESHIDGAILIPDTEIEERATEELTDKDARILIYCRSGRRSALVAQALADMGYTNVYDFGGIIDWAGDTVSG
jgi:rhodanese-related sulfurtransferase